LTLKQQWKCKIKIFSCALLSATRESPSTLLVGLDGSQIKVIKFSPPTFKRSKSLNEEQKRASLGSNS